MIGGDWGPGMQGGELNSGPRVSIPAQSEAIDESKGVS